MAQERVIDVGERTAHIEGLAVGIEKRLSNVEIEVRDLRGEIKDLRAEMKTEIGGLRSEIKSEMVNLRVGIKSEMDQRFDSMEKRFTLLQGVVILIYPLLIAMTGKLFLMK